jgi:hypothetical protein
LCAHHHCLEVWSLVQEALGHSQVVLVQRVVQRSRTLRASRGQRVAEGQGRAGGAARAGAALRLRAWCGGWVWLGGGCGKVNGWRRGNAVAVEVRLRGYPARALAMLTGHGGRGESIRSSFASMLGCRARNLLTALAVKTAFARRDVEGGQTGLWGGGGAARGAHN